MLIVLFISPLFAVITPKYTYKFIEIENISRYNEDRIAFQHVEHFKDAYLDNSIECLAIIKDKKIYLIKDGYDDIYEVKEQRLLMDMQRLLIDDEAMWKNTINGQPDYVKVTDRRVELMRNQDEKFVSEKFGNYYKTVRDAFVKRHVDIFAQLMKNRRESEMSVRRKPVAQKLFLSKNPGAQKFSISATAKTTDGRVYYCEDADGDGITETFTVTIPDGFNWGYKSGPNIILIYNNQKDDIKELIKDLTNRAYFGTDDEKEEIVKNLPEEKDLIEMVEDLAPFDKFYK